MEKEIYLPNKDNNKINQYLLCVMFGMWQVGNNSLLIYKDLFMCDVTWHYAIIGVGFLWELVGNPLVLAYMKDWPGLVNNWSNWPK